MASNNWKIELSRRHKAFIKIKYIVHHKASLQIVRKSVLEDILYYNTIELEIKTKKRTRFWEKKLK